jgi:hypothetical protein
VQAQSQTLSHPTGGWQVESLSWLKAKNANFLMLIYNNGCKSLVYAERHMDKHFCRFRTVLQPTVRSLDTLIGGVRSSNDDNECDDNTEHKVLQIRSLLTVVDHAGSERVQKSRSQGQRL